MTEIRVENVSNPGHKIVLNELLNGDFSYTPEGGQIDDETFEIKFGAGEYAVVYDELLDRKQDELTDVNSEDYKYRDVYDAFPRTVNVDDGDSVTVSM